MNSPGKILAFFFIFQNLYCVADYPVVRFAASSRDSIYSQQQQDLEAWYSGKTYSPVLSIYKYRPKFGEDLFSLSAAFNLPYESIVTLNGWDSPISIAGIDYVLIPNIPGIFVPEIPRDNWEKDIKNARTTQSGEMIQVNRSDGDSLGMLFYEGEKFTREERIRFLSSKFIMPLKNQHITSPFGYRKYFLTRKQQFHTGMDFRAEIGTPVLASRKGRVNRVGKLKSFGIYITISHDGKYETFYSHLNKIFVSVNEKVSSGQIIALSGNSGISTGPHLHFEIRKNGIPIDPMNLLE